MELNLRELLEIHPPPWSEAPDASNAVLDASGRRVEVAVAPVLRPGLVAAVNVAADYLEVIDDLLAECAEFGEPTDLHLGRSGFLRPTRREEQQGGPPIPVAAGS